MDQKRTDKFVKFLPADKSKHIKNNQNTLILVCILYYNGLSRHILSHWFVILYKSLKTFHDFVHYNLNSFVLPDSVFIYIFALVIVRALPSLVRTYLIIIINDRYSRLIGQVRAYRDLCPCAVANDAPPRVGF